MTDRAPPALPPPHYTGGQVAMLAIGSILLLPGLCSLIFVLQALPELRLPLDSFTQLIAMLWLICFAISAGGLALIIFARRRARGQ